LFDPLEVLEANYVLVKDVFFHTCKALSRLFGIFFPKMKKEVPEKLAKVVEVFNADEDLKIDFQRDPHGRHQLTRVGLSSVLG
jgi:hypothetical protein